jgi:CRP-like cAMP-binding protein
VNNGVSIAGPEHAPQGSALSRDEIMGDDIDRGEHEEQDWNSGEPTAEEQGSQGSSSDQGAPKNRLLSALPMDEFAYLEPYLERVHMKVNDVIAQPGEVWTHVYFPEASIISVLNVMADGSAVEVGTVGNEGMSGLAAYLEADTGESQTICQLTGPALRVRVEVVVEAAAKYPTLRRMLSRYTQAYMTQVSQNAACNRLHSIEQRCARWLLMTQDRMPKQDDIIVLKQEFLAMMLGVRRVGVTIAAGLLQDAGLIRYRRGSIRVLDREGLEAASCECYGIVRRHFDRLLA